MRRRRQFFRNLLLGAMLLGFGGLGLSCVEDDTQIDNDELATSEHELFGQATGHDACLLNTATNCEHAWTRVQQVHDASPLTDVWAASSSDVRVVGWNMPYRFYRVGTHRQAHGRVLTWDGLQWTEEPGPSATLSAIHGAPKKAPVVVGSGGTIARWDGGGWTLEPSVTKADLSDIIFTKHNVFYAVGSSGTIVWSHGNQIELIDPGTSADLNGIWGTGGVAIAVGDDATLLTLTADKIVRNTTAGSTSKDLNAIWGTGGVAIGVGADGAVVEMPYNPKGIWGTGGVATPTTPTVENLNAIWGTGGVAIAVGDNGAALIRTTRGQWVAIEPFTGENLTAVSGTSLDNIFVTSESGSVWHFGLRR